MDVRIVPRDPDPNGAARPPSEAPAGTTRPRVLFAEDDPATVAVLTHRLERVGMDVEHHADGASALAAATQGFDLALIDVSLTGVDGFSLLTRLRERAPVMPVVVLCWPGNDQHVARAFELGAADVIVRPFSLLEATARLTRLLSR